MQVSTLGAARQAMLRLGHDPSHFPSASLRFNLTACRSCAMQARIDDGELTGRAVVEPCRPGEKREIAKSYLRRTGE